MQPTTGARTRRAISIVGALALIAGMVGFGTVASGAWFTATKSSSATVTGALLTIGEIGKNADQKTIAVADVSPMTDVQAAAGAKSEWVTVRNTGTIPLDWTMSIVNPQAKAPLTAAQLANFRFRLFDESGAALTAPLVLGAMPAVSQPGLFLTQGSALPAGEQKKVEIRVWLDQNSGNEFQGSGASFDVIINGIQNGGDAPALTDLGMTATRSGTPSGSTTALRWNDAKAGLSSLGYGGTPTYTVERSRTSDFASTTTVYSGSSIGATDTKAGTPSTTTVTTASAAADPSDFGLCTLDVSGSVYCREPFYYDSNTPQPLLGGAVKVGGLLEGVKVVKISEGGTRCAISDTGKLYCWGRHPGDGVTVDSTETPVLVNTGALAGKTIVDVVTNESFDHAGACAVASDGTAACWGREGYEGQFSRGAGSSVPVSINYGALAGKAIKQVQFNPYGACARASDSTVACWGANMNGLLGNGTATITGYPARAEFTTVAPVRVAMPYLGSASVIDLSSASMSACALTSDNRIYCWGEFWPWKQTAATTPYLLSSGGLTGITDIEVIRSGICAISNRVLYCWGFNYLGTLGSNVAIDSTTYDWQMEPGTWRDSPTRVTGVLSGQNVSQVSGSDGGMRICAVSASGQASCWGKGFDQSGDPVQAPRAVSNPIARVCADGGTVLTATTCGLSTTGAYYYRVSYAVAGVAGWKSPFSVAARG